MKINDIPDMLRYANYLPAYLGIKDYTLNEGRGKGMRLFDILNGSGMELTVCADRCLDITKLRYRGINIALNTNAGVGSPALYDKSVDGWLRNFNGGLVETCGLTAVGAECVDDGEKCPLHGLIGNTPAEEVSARITELNDELVILVSGKVRQTKVFCEDIVLERKIIISTESNYITIQDKVHNQGFLTQPLMIMLHCNFGYPLLEPGSRLYFSTTKVNPVDEQSAEKVSEYDLMTKAEEKYTELCYLHSGGNDNRNVLVYNERLGLAVKMSFDARQFSWLNQWKSMCAGNYAIGIEPSNCHHKGRDKARADGSLQFIEPGETRDFDVRFSILDEEKTIKDVIRSLDT